MKCNVALLVTLAKGLGAGLPIGAILCNQKTSSVFNPGDHGSTFGGNPVSCAGAIVVLDEICNEGTYASIEKKGQLVKTLLNNSSSSKIKEIRGKGLILGIEIEGSSSEVQKKAAEKGLLVLTAGPNVIRLLPPLIISEDELSDGINTLISCL